MSEQLYELKQIEEKAWKAYQDQVDMDIDTGATALSMRAHTLRTAWEQASREYYAARDAEIAAAPILVDYAKLAQDDDNESIFKSNREAAGYGQL